MVENLVSVFIKIALAMATRSLAYEAFPALLYCKYLNKNNVLIVFSSGMSRYSVPVPSKTSCATIQLGKFQINNKIMLSVSIV